MYPKIQIAISIFYTIGFFLLTTAILLIVFMPISLSGPLPEMLFILMICGDIVIFFSLFYILKQKYYEKRFLLIGALSGFTGGFLVFNYYWVIKMEETQIKLRELEEGSPILGETYNKFFLDNAEIIKFAILLSAIIFIVVGAIFIIYHYWKKPKDIRFSIQSSEEIKSEDFGENAPY